MLSAVQAVKRISAQHRLILSGTPIQNSVLELWALFDFLMPGFLGTHAAFNVRYGRALAASKSSKTGSPEAQAGLLAMEGLHKQVGPPFLATLHIRQHAFLRSRMLVVSQGHCFGICGGYAWRLCRVSKARHMSIVTCR